MSAKNSPRRRIFTIVLTGGIAAGKSTVSAEFARLGVPIIDTDCIAREIVEPGQPALISIVEQLGEQFLDSSGKLNRRKLRKAIFLEPDIKEQLESILHPKIFAEARRRILELDASYCIVVVPLYSDANSWEGVDRVLVIDTEQSDQIERVTARDDISRQLATAIVAAQPGRASRLAIADDVIRNIGGKEDLVPQVEKLHRMYLELANRAKPNDEEE